MRIDAISAQPDRAGRYTVSFSDGTTMRLYWQTMQDFGIYSEKELSQQQYEALCCAASDMSARMRAVRIVSACSISEKDLKQRLIHKGEDPGSAQKAVNWMLDMGLVDDGKTAEQIVARCISKGYGISRAKQVLYEKRIDKSYWDGALENYPDQEDAIKKYIQTHLPPDPDGKAVKKVIDALMRKGHSYSTIRRALDQVDGLEEEDG